MSVPPLLTEVAPGFAAALEAGLREDGEIGLPEQVPALRIVALCGCNDDFCGSFYTAPSEERTTGKDLDTTPLNASTGNNIVAVDTTDGQIVYVEVIDDGALRAMLKEAGIV
ncbi:MAG TPA: hypothetical protein VH572_02725 [Gaiella sp.]|jgi:hypothetical protein